MLTLGLSAKPLLTKANTLSVIIDDILLDGLLAAVIDSRLTKVILGVLGEEMLTCNLFDG